MIENFIKNDNLKFNSRSEWEINKNFLGFYLIGLIYFNKRDIIFVLKENDDINWIEKNILLWKDFLCVEFDVIRYLFPVRDPFINNKISQDFINRKNELIKCLSNNNRMIVLATISSLNIKIEKESLSRNEFEIFVGLEIERKRLITEIINMGYKLNDYVQSKGDLSYRGSIIDVFPVDSEFPFRIEFEADEIVSIRKFNPNTQVSIDKVNGFMLKSNRYFVKFDDFSDYMNSNDKNNNESMFYLHELMNTPMFVFNDYNGCVASFEKMLQNFRRIKEILEQEDNKKFLHLEKIFFLDLNEFEYKNLYLNANNFEDDLGFYKIDFDFNSYGVKDLEKIEELLKKDYGLFLAVENSDYIEEFSFFVQEFSILKKDFWFSFINTKEKIMVLAKKEEKNEKSELKDKKIKSLDEISVNDYVVHKIHGIGIFKGLETIRIDEKEIDFLKIEYLDNEFLFVPVYDINVLQKYTSFKGVIPKLDKLGGNTWVLKQKKAKRNIINFAKELLELYAIRKSIKGNSFLEVEELENKLIDEFEYIETIDQKKAIEDVLNDLEKPYPMDRLVCGDVSFGKTEVAIRASFRVVINGKQVVLLCPTTILAEQHYRTFNKRLKNFPINIGMISRGIKKKDREKVYNDVKNGKIDILIGTHSVLSDKLKFKDLGLIIIDEEQRFGVFQKEKLKSGREHVDVLMLSATPIPRTLSFALSGLQDISLILTPPIGRFAVKNYVYTYSNDIIYSAVLREIERDGLVYIVYNNINKIYKFKEKLEKVLKDIPVRIIHAKMRPLLIEKTLSEFINKKYRVLISTTIIENGIDISDVNTLIVVNAENFGLTQLYQLRGRIGRGSRQAYAYFLVGKESVTEKAEMRLDAIREFAQLGSGYKIAEFDLKLRGAGSLLGNKQHGHIEALGFDFYMDLLEKTIRELKGDKVSEKKREIKYNFSYYADTDYFNNSSERIGFYRSITGIKTFEELKNAIDELIDRYGYVSENIEKIFYAVFIKILADFLDSERVEAYLDQIYFENINSINNIKKIEKFSVICTNSGIKIEFNDYKEYKRLL